MNAVGTYLTLRSNTLLGEQKVERSLLSLLSDGQAVLVDTSQRGAYGYQPFTEGRGTWRYRNQAKDRVELSVLILHFTCPTQNDPDVKIARLQTTATYIPDANKMSGDTAIVFLPVTGDPFKSATIGSPIEYTFSGYRLLVPE
jgi:hypothetical protein